MKRVLAALAVALAVTACSPDALPVPNETDVDVDTPALVEAKEAAGIADCTPGSGAAVDGGLPSITLPCLGGGADLDLSSLRGPLVVNVWGAWCTPCRREIPRIVDFYDKYGDRVPVLGIDYGDVIPSAAIEMLAKNDATYPQVADPGGDILGQGVIPARLGLPLTAFVDADGRATVVMKELKSTAELVDLVGQHLGVEL